MKNKTEKSNENESFFYGGFIESINSDELKKKMETFHKRHDEDMNFNCKKCAKKISAHNKDWHAGLCDNCFEIFQ